MLILLIPDNTDLAISVLADYHEDNGNYDLADEIREGLSHQDNDWIIDNTPQRLPGILNPHVQEQDTVGCNYGSIPGAGRHIGIGAVHGLLIASVVGSFMEAMDDNF